MTILIMILRKMINNKWLVLGLLIGLVLAVAVVSCMPMYSNAILHRLMIKEFEQFQIENHQYPGIYQSNATFFASADNRSSARYFHAVDQFLDNTALPHFGIPVIEHVRERVTEQYSFIPVPQSDMNSPKRLASFNAIEGLEKHIRLVDGRMPSGVTENGNTYEVLVAAEVLDHLDVVLNQEFKLAGSALQDELFVKLVGVIDKKSFDDLFWRVGDLSHYRDTFFVPFDLFEKDFTEVGIVPVKQSYWHTVLDYTEMKRSIFAEYVQTHNMIEERLKKSFINYYSYTPILESMEQFADKEKQLGILLLSLNIPILVLLAYYIYMVSTLIIGKQKQEISVLISRGAGSFQIGFMYLIECVLMSILAILLGPYIGLLLTKLLGGSNGFLEFVNRTAFDIDIPPSSYVQSVYVLIGATIMMLIPVIKATKSSIVEHKLSKSKKSEVSSFFHRYYLDIILLGVSIYGLQRFHQQLNDLQLAGLDFLSFQVDPFLFLIPALFVFGMGLLILRIYPFALKLLYWLGWRWWPPFLYASLLQVSRSATQYQFLMVFLSMTIAIGFFNASVARTMNQNYEDKIYYDNGTDIILQPQWEAELEQIIDEESGDATTVGRQYIEPPMTAFTELSGVAQTAQVFLKRETKIQTENGNTIANLMGINTKEFGQTSWYRKDLYEHHYYDYLNLIAGDSTAVLISTTLAEEFEIIAGDIIQITWNGVDNFTSFTVYGIIDYFPTFNPNDKWIVGHLSYIQTQIGFEPYDIWVKLNSEESREEFYDSMFENDLKIVNFEDSYDELIFVKSDAYVLAINGVMTLVFMISILLCFIGFLVFWIITLSSRFLQIGVFRAMGVSFSQIVGMLAFEQLLTSVTAIFIGLFTGLFVSQYFVPLFQMSFNMSELALPFQVVVFPEDIARICITMTGILIFGLLVLAYMLKRVNIHQAIKLGEE